jgi:hypothetical protein
MNRAHLPRLFLASAILVSALGVAPALSRPAPAPAAKDLPDPLHPCTVLLCLPEPGKAAPAATSAGQPTDCAKLAAVPDKLASDPEEGGQIARTAKPKPQVSDMTVTKRADTASTKLMDSAAPASTCAPVQH